MTMRCVAGRRPSLSGTARRKTGGRVMDCQSVACPPARQTAPFHGHSPNSLQLFHQRHALVVDAPSSTGHDASAWRRHQCVTSPDYRISRQTASFTQSGRSTSLTQGCIVPTYWPGGANVLSSNARFFGPTGLSCGGSRNWIGFVASPPPIFGDLGKLLQNFA